ncbi:unnamed protein product [Trifolium pratense]|nr:unnamed protein product [Trifolium pratense]
MAAEEDHDRESEGEGDNLMALNSLVIANNSPIIAMDQAEDLNFEREKSGEFSNNSIYVDPNLYTANCDSARGCAELEGGVEEKDILNVINENLLGQEVAAVGPTESIKSHQDAIGGVNRGLSNSENLGRTHKPNSLCYRDSGGKGERKRGVYSDGPRQVYNKLNYDPKSFNTPHKKKFTHKNKGKALQTVIPPSASLRKQHQLVQSLISRNSTARSSSSVVRPAHSNGFAKHQREGVVTEGVTRNPPSNFISRKLQASSISSAGDILCCSSINSSDIRNCNKIFLKKYDREVASKVWNGALELGVEVTSLAVEKAKELKTKGNSEEKCIQEIQPNEKRDAEERFRREQQPSLHQ